MWSTPAVWKQYNKMDVLHFFLVNSTLIYILFSLLGGDWQSEMFELKTSAYLMRFKERFIDV